MNPLKPACAHLFPENPARLVPRRTPTLPPADSACLASPSSPRPPPRCRLPRTAGGEGGGGAGVQNAVQNLIVDLNLLLHRPTLIITLPE